jgi:hypothetical protein
MGNEEYVWYGESQLHWLDFLSTNKENYFLFPNIISKHHTDFQYTCEINAGVFVNVESLKDVSKNKDAHFYIGYFDDEDSPVSFRPLFEVPYEDWHWSGGGFRINFSNKLKEISIKKELSYREVPVRLYEN